MAFTPKQENEILALVNMMANAKTIDVIATPDGRGGVMPGGSVPAVDLSVYLRTDGLNALKTDMDIGGHALKNVKAPVNDDDVATKKYVDSVSFNAGGINAALFVRTDGSSTMQSALDMGNQRVTNVGDPRTDLDAINKRTLASSIADAIREIEGRASKAGTLDATGLVKADGSTPLTGNLNAGGKTIYNIAQPKSGTDAVPLSFIQQYFPSTINPNTGAVERRADANLYGTKLTNVGTPVADTDAATKGYTDKAIADAVGTIKQAPGGGGAATPANVDLTGLVKRDGTAPLTGNLNAGGKKITNLAQPTEALEAANKQYVDSARDGARDAAVSSAKQYTDAEVAKVKAAGGGGGGARKVISACALFGTFRAAIGGGSGMSLTGAVLNADTDSQISIKDNAVVTVPVTGVYRVSASCKGITGGLWLNNGVASLPWTTLPASAALAGGPDGFVEGHARMEAGKEYRLSLMCTGQAQVGSNLRLVIDFLG